MPPFIPQIDILKSFTVWNSAVYYYGGELTFTGALTIVCFGNRKFAGTLNLNRNKTEVVEVARYFGSWSDVL